METRIVIKGNQNNLRIHDYVYPLYLSDKRDSEMGKN